MAKFFSNLGICEKKEKSQKILVFLILLMFVIQTVDNVVTWHQIWVGFIKYGETPEGLAVLELVNGIPGTRVVLILGEVLSELNLWIADGITVGCFPL
jgi:hypothetical protein